MSAPQGVVGRKFSLIPKKHRKAIYSRLFKAGVMVVKKDPTLSEHPDVKGIPNLHVMMTLKSLKSRAYVTEVFVWCHHYYVLTNSGIEYLREELQLPPKVFPATLMKKPGNPGGMMMSGGGPPNGDSSGDWRRGPGGLGRGRGRRMDNADGGNAFSAAMAEPAGFNTASNQQSVMA